METLLIKKPDIDLLKKQCDIVQKVLSGGDSYIAAGDLIELQGLVNFIDNVCDVAEGHEQIMTEKDQVVLGNNLAVMFNLKEKENGRFDVIGWGDYTALGLYRVCKRVVLGGYPR